MSELFGVLFFETNRKPIFLKIKYILVNGLPVKFVLPPKWLCLHVFIVK